MSYTVESFKSDKSIARDVTRLIYPGGRYFYDDAFIAYTLERIDEVSRLDEIPKLDYEWDASTSERRLASEAARLKSKTRDELRRKRYDEALVHIARAFNLRLSTVRGWTSHHHGLTIEERARFEEWEAASRRLQPVRDLVAIMRELPTENRDRINAAIGALDDSGRHEVRRALDCYLLAADLMDEVRRQLQAASERIAEVYDRQGAAEPLVAHTTVAESEFREAAKPLVDTGTRVVRRRGRNQYSLAVPA